MTIAKEMRPKAKWTWWAFPWQSRWTHDTDREFHTLSRKEYEAEARHILRHVRLNSLPD